MARSERSLGVPKPPKRRNVTAFAEAPRIDETPKPSANAAPSQPAPPAKPRRASAGRAAPPREEMVRVHTTLGVEVTATLKQRAAAGQRTYTDILAEAFITHGTTLTAHDDTDHRARYEAAGFRPPRPPVEEGRMSVAFYMPAEARASLDRAAKDAGYPSRSAFIDALLRRHFDMPA